MFNSLIIYKYNVKQDEVMLNVVIENQDELTLDEIDGDIKKLRKELNNIKRCTHNNTNKRYDIGILFKNIQEKINSVDCSKAQHDERKKDILIRKKAIIHTIKLLFNSFKEINNENTISRDSEDHVDTLLLQKQKHEVKPLTELDIIERDIDNRNKHIDNLAEDVVIVGDMFKDLHTLVNDQGVVLNSIEDNVDISTNHVDHGCRQLKKANHDQECSKFKLCMLSIVLTMLAIIFFIVKFA